MLRTFPPVSQDSYAEGVFTMIASSLLPQTAAVLRNGQLDLLEYVEQTCDRLDALDPQIEAFLPEPDRRARLRRQALELQARYPTPDSRPPLYGVMLGVKDIFHVDGLPTRAGSQVPAEALAGAQSVCVRVLRENGALVLGKAVTTEFAYFEPGATHNPHNLAHTPGGSSSGSAAAVAAGFCPLALGTQTIGSVLRPASYCGIVGFKPSYGRIPPDGVIPISVALDHVGLFTQDVAGMELAASLVFREWQPASPPDRLPVLGIPTGAYLDWATPEALAAFESHVALLEGAGYQVKRVPVLNDFAQVREQTFRIMAAEMSDTHRDWFPQYGHTYRPRTVKMITDGLAVTPEQRADDLAIQAHTRAALLDAMADNQIDLWITPAATSAAPLGLASTGDPAMSLPWTLVGFPAIALRTNSLSPEGLPFGLQVAAAPMTDERLLHWCKRMEPALLA
jgi:Asp-tRNA(Asn)/Glu-tRNA(Gln) amidotransferase A subunit family amidase